MAPWAQIAKPFSVYFALNCIKTLVGAGFVGYGVALALMPEEEDNGNGNDNDDDSTNDDGLPRIEKSNSDRGTAVTLITRCVGASAAIGFGLFLSLPSLTSQILWETMIPGITASDIAYDVGTENVKGILPRWKLPKPEFSSLVPSKEKLVSGLIREAGIMADDSSGNRKK